MCFKSFDIKNNKIINWFAASTLSIYLVHYNNYYISQKLYEFIANIYDGYPAWKAYFIMFGVAFALIIIVPIIDKIRIISLTPIIDVLEIKVRNINLNKNGFF